MMEDAELLRRYAAERSEEAFAELVRRHLALVYSVALRQMRGEAHLAEDVTQKVFADLARKAAALSRHPVISGWLYRSTQFAAIDVLRAERRRRTREREAQTMHDLLAGSGGEVDGDKLGPVLDQVMGELGDRDRDAVVLRYFEGRPFAEIGRKLRLKEDAARMRVERALDKLRALLAKRGVSSTSAALALALANQAGVAAPAGLATAVTGAVLAGAGAAATGGVTTAILQFMSMTKLQLGITGALAIAGAGGFALQQQDNNRLRREIDSLHAENRQIAVLRDENLRLAKTAAEVETLRQDDAALTRLRAEADGLNARLQETSRVQSAAAKKPAGETAAPAGMYEMNALNQVPRPITRTPPAYPADMRQAGISGQVVVDLVVGADGAVHNAVAVSSTQREFEAPAVEAVSQWTFSPGKHGGSAVNTHLQVPIVFSLGKDVAGVATPGTLHISQGGPDSETPK